MKERSARTVAEIEIRFNADTYEPFELKLFDFPLWRFEETLFFPHPFNRARECLRYLLGTH